MADYTKAIELNPDYVLAYVHRADVYEKRAIVLPHSLIA